MRNCLLVCAVLAAAPSGAFGSVIYSNFASAGNLYNPNSGLLIEGALSSTSDAGAQTDAFAFTPSANYEFQELDLAVSLIDTPDDIVVSLWSSNGGLPGTALMGWLFNDLPAVATCCTFLTGLADPPFELFSGQQYWVVVAGNAFGNPQFDWNLNLVGDIGPVAGSSDGGPFTAIGSETQGAFQVLGEAVPEPSAALLVLSGLALLARRGGGRR